MTISVPSGSDSEAAARPHHVSLALKKLAMPPASIWSAFRKAGAGFWTKMRVKSRSLSALSDSGFTKSALACQYDRAFLLAYGNAPVGLEEPLLLRRRDEAKAASRVKVDSPLGRCPGADQQWFRGLACEVGQ